MASKKAPEEIAAMRRSGSILAETIDLLEEAIRPGVTTAELDAVAARSISDAGAEASFHGYRGFPASICASPNDVIVHGIPNERRLDEGDIVSLDVGVFYEGWHSDSAWTFPVGEVDAAAHDLLKVTEASLDAAIDQCRPGKHLGDVGHAVDQTATSAGFSVVREYAGHGIGRQLHEDLWVPNFGPPGRRELLVVGVTLAVEPMLNLGGPETKTLSDGWTVVTADGSLSAHFEHTIAITPEGCEVLTRREAR
ncbi:MAG TPA: type I methionyl aminopeptidase [Actinomycetota bacterium]|nr:type I methionyl aminopeptidase [Actinomycetota bacterium]